MRNRILYLISYLFIGIGILNAQSAYLEVVCFVESSKGDPIKTAKAELYEGNTRIQSVSTDLKGKLSFKLNYNKNYRIIVSKEGMIQKRIDFNTNAPAEEQRILRKEFAMSLVENCDGANTVVFKEPVDIIEYDAGFGNFVSNDAHYQQMQSKFASAYRSIDQCKQDKFDEKKQEADQQFNQHNYEEAIALYQEALEMNPNDGSVKRQISTAKKNIEKQQVNSQRYDQLIREADQYLGQGNLTTAKTKYFEAQKLKPNDTYPQTKIAEINTTIAQQQAEAQKQQELNAEYNNLVKQANSAMAAKNYPLAQQLYEKAGTIKPSEALPSQKVAEAQQALKQQQAAQAERERINTAFQEAMTAGNSAMQQKEYVKAQEHYQSALALKPSEALPRQKINEAQKLEDQRQKDLLAAQKAEVEIQYAEAIALADGNVAQKKFAEAISAYEQAMVIKPSDKYAQQQIVKINNLIVEEEQAKNAAVEKQYNDAIAKGDAAKLKKEFESAIAAYNTALGAKPGDAIATSKQAEAQKLLADQQRMFKEEQENKTQYNELVQKADGLFQAQDYPGSKSAYNQALSIYPGEQYPKNQIAIIDNIIAKNQREAEYNALIAEADGLFNNKSWEVAKSKYNAASAVFPENNYPRDQINTINKNISNKARAELEAKYNDLTVQAEQQVIQNNFEQAKGLYQEASQVIPENPYPQQRINEINQMISDAAKSATEAKYNELTGQAEQHVTQKNYEQAKGLYREASQVLPENPYPQQRINEINQLISDAAKSATEAKYNELAAQAEQEVTLKNFDQAKNLYNQASQVLPENPYPKQRINEINQMISNEAFAATQAKYDNFVTRAEEQVIQKDYEQAKNLLTQASGVMPENPFPQRRINEINKLIDGESRQQTLDKYNKLVAEADALFGSENFSQAKVVYTQALGVIPSEAYPQTKINEINALISANARQKVLNNYNASVALGDQNFDQKNYTVATSAYRKAISIMPEQTYPQQKINEISAILTEQARLKADNEAAEARYSAVIELANKYFNDQNYPLAISEYNKALTMKPGDVFPKQQIDEINEILTNQQRLLAEQQEVEQKYKEAIARADELFKSRTYTDAKSHYQEALSYKPEDIHASSQIGRIDQLLADAQAEADKKKQRDQLYASHIASGDVFYNSNKFKESKQSYLAALEVIPGQDYPRSQIRKIDEKLRIIAMNQANVRTESTTTPVTTSSTTKTSTTGGSSGQKLGSFTFKSESERKKYLENLKTKYSEGVTKEVYTEKSSTTTRYIVIRNDEVNEFREIRFKWGGVEYKMNGKPTNSFYLNSQVKPREGENFSEVKM
jgi:tetratricopeptide (TPR) repeat protein